MRRIVGIAHCTVRWYNIRTPGCQFRGQVEEQRAAATAGKAPAAAPETPKPAAMDEQQQQSEAERLLQGQRQYYNMVHAVRCAQLSGSDNMRFS